MHPTTCTSLTECVYVCVWGGGLALSLRRLRQGEVVSIEKLHVQLFAHTIICTHYYLHAQLFARTIICTYNYLHVQLLARTIICTHNCLHVQLFATHQGV
jgi:ABC-type sugar transport system ATPase subunit